MFMKDYHPAEQGGYREGMGISEKYHTWAAAQYKEKVRASLLLFILLTHQQLAAEVQGQDWSPSSPPANFGQPISRPSSAQGMRKSRASARSNLGSSLRNDSASPAPGFRGTSSSTSLTDAAYETKTANESYFAGLGEANAQRRDDLPPSQGGKYQGFGSTPPVSSHPSYGTSSAAMPTLGEIQTQPVQALSKGWSLLSMAVTAAGKVVAEKAMDPALHDSVKSYAASAGKLAMDTSKSANEWSKRELGVDVADRVSGVADKAKGALGIASHPGGGYSAVGGGHGSQTGYGTWHDEDDSRLYAEGDDDFFDRHGAGGEDRNEFNSPTTPATANSNATSGSSAPLTTKGAKKEEAEKDEWAW